MLFDLLSKRTKINDFFKGTAPKKKQSSCGCGKPSGSCSSAPKKKQSSCGCGKPSGSCSSTPKAAATPPPKSKVSDGYDQMMDKKMSRRGAFSKLTKGLMAGAGLAQTACSVTSSKDDREKSQMQWDEYFKTNYRLMTDTEKDATVDRLQRLYEKRTGKHVNISKDGAVDNVLYGYAFNVSKCQGYMDCVNACVEENNQDRSTQMQYIRIHEIENGQVRFAGDDNFFHEVPAAGHFYMGTQCYHCENPPCVDVCPVGATWQEEDGIVVVDFDWCIGCRYCMAACPYDGRRFNWKEPEVPEEEVNLVQHYLGNRMRKKGVVEKCTFCIQRSRKGQNPACVEARPTGARIFGNLLDPNSQIRWVLDNKKVFRLKEDLGTEPKFWYFMD